jgi:hypothetical protein
VRQEVIYQPPQVIYRTRSVIYHPRQVIYRAQNVIYIPQPVILRLDYQPYFTKGFSRFAGMVAKKRYLGVCRRTEGNEVNEEWDSVWIVLAAHQPVPIPNLRSLR